MKKFLKTNIVIICIVFCGSLLRFFNPLWDAGLYLHPDERLFINASNLSLPTSVGMFFSPNSPLNPHMFYYGSLLLYLYKLVSLLSPFSFLMTSRLVSAFFSSVTIGTVFLIGKKLFSKKIGILSSIVFAFASGSIQYAHFNTTESSLIFLVALITYVDILAVVHKKITLLLLSLLLVGIAGSIKITGFFFGLSPLITILLLVKERIPLGKILVHGVVGLFFSFLIYCLFSPYQFIDYKEFVTQQSYMQAVTYGVFKPPFVLIYNNALPYVYQAFQVFPFIFGFISFPLALLGVFFLLKGLFQEKKNMIHLFLLVFPILYFAWSGAWFAKYARYYLLLLPFLSVWTAYVINKFSKPILLIFLFFIAINGILFARIYLSDNTRVIASQWMYQHVPNNSIIATEHWDDALPLLLSNQSKSFTEIMLPVYDAETKSKITNIANSLSTTNYIVLSSRRVYASIEKNQSTYPQTNRIYSLLFSGELGFEIVHKQVNYPFFFSDDFADETFQSYDHPPVVIFMNTKHFSQEKLLNLIENH